MKNPFSTFRTPALHLFLIAAVALLVYGGTFSVPFHFDDKLNITENSLIKDPSNFWPPAGMRWFGYLTFALNYQVNGLDPAGYHAVNLAIHIAAAFLVYWLVLLTFSTTYWTAAAFNDPEGKKTQLTALVTALIFACHPVQTQAVTYIVQRFASLAAMLYLLSLTTYVKARLLTYERNKRMPATNEKPALARVLLYAVSLVAAFLAMKTKETAFTLPAVIILYELCFLPAPAWSDRPRSLRRSLVVLLPIILVIIALALFGSGRLDEAAASLRATNDISRIDYLLTQFPVVATYVRLLLLPVDQSIDYDIPVYHGFLEPAVLFSFAFLTLLLALAVILFFRSRIVRGPARLAAFGLLWFFITLSVESSMIPLPDVIFEHRLYLPSIGFILAVAGGVLSGWGRLQQRYRQAKNVFPVLIVSLLVVLAVATFMRNRVWSSEIGLWENAVASHPASHRAHTVLGGLYKNSGRREDAKRSFLRSLALKPSYAEAHVNLGSIYAEEGRLDDAMREFMTAVQIRGMDEIDTGLLFVQIGNVYRMKNMPDREIEYYTYALGLVPGDASVHILLGRAYQAKGMHQRAAEHFQRARQLNPDRY